MTDAPRTTSPHDPAATEHTRRERTRFALIGAITAGIGDDLRNAVMPALLRLDTLSASHDMPLTARQALQRVRASLVPLQQLASGLHLLSTDSEPAVGAGPTTDLLLWWRQLEPLVLAASAPGTRLQCNVPDALRVVEIPPSLLSHVVMALVLNARHGTTGSESPRLTISVATVARGAELIVQHAGQAPGRPGMLRRDSGSPCAESPVVAIAGLRLAELRAHVQAYGGDLSEIERSPDGGTFLVRIRLTPATAAAATHAKPTPGGPGAEGQVWDGAFSVLCIDDNELLVDALEGRLMLEVGFSGLHRAMPLSSAAIIAARERPEIILLDHDLPEGIDALELLETLRRDAPDSRVIMFTGYAHGQLIANAMHRGASGFVSKGASVERLLEAMRRVLLGEAIIELDA